MIENELIDLHLSNLLGLSTVYTYRVKFAPCYFRPFSIANVLPRLEFAQTKLFKR